MVTKRKTPRKVAHKAGRKTKGSWNLLGLTRKEKGATWKEMGTTERKVMSKKTGVRWKKGDSTVKVLKRKQPKFRF